jgi:hypothetical protein
MTRSRSAVTCSLPAKPAWGAGRAESSSPTPAALANTAWSIPVTASAMTSASTEGGTSLGEAIQDFLVSLSDPAQVVHERLVGSDSFDFCDERVDYCGVDADASSAGDYLDLAPPPRTWPTTLLTDRVTRHPSH